MLKPIPFVLLLKFIPIAIGFDSRGGPETGYNSRMLDGGDPYARDELYRRDDRLRDDLYRDREAAFGLRRRDPRDPFDDRELVRMRDGPYGQRGDVLSRGMLILAGMALAHIVRFIYLHAALVFLSFSVPTLLNFILVIDAEIE